MLQIVTNTVFYSFIFDACFAFSSICLIGIFGRLLIKKINARIINFFILSSNSNQMFVKSGNFQIYKSVKQFIGEHNQLCIKVEEYNKFWNKLYFAFLLTIIPMNLMSFHQLFFEPLDFEYRLFVAFSAFVMILDLFAIQYCFASNSNQIHKTTKLLARLQWRLNGWPFRLQTKLKLMSYFERLSHKKKIGFTIGPTIVLTFPVFYQVIKINFCKLLF